MNRIFEGLESTGSEPIGHSNGNHAGIEEEVDRFPGRRASQTTSAGTVVVDEPAASRVEFMPPPVLEMDHATRQELIRLTHTVFLRSGGSRVVAFSGVEPGVGCSWLLVRVAGLLAAADAGSVCVVDANLHAPSLHTYLRVGNRCGLSDALIDPHPVCEYALRISRRFHLLSSGSMAWKAERLLASSTFRACVDELRTAYDFVLLDTPPLAESSDALVVASTADGLAMVVEAHSTSRDIALKAAREAVTTNTRVLGVVLNKRTYPIPRTIYKKLRYA
ncbi:CpsD/CapB family tyrosine-protein kinase [Alloacidobacterium sp.]|uniref:CpsD/CapB family tyrosine-protein kinase n=1 Tax=Alloacidobacterium sp. TaxID=2951999 RepID=UPI002D28B3C5|nr:CpsD/CapB family tyrosine-protein kinase [Alloacidobacterium sp.]HYK36748.1 CpsD/CapB family tyrosine-protein kinase [Alloacidobacterium sp.]